MTSSYIAAKPGQSVVWKYFVKENPKITRCKICNKSLRYSSSTSNMRQHLDRQHPLVIAMAGDTISYTTADVVAAQTAAAKAKSSASSFINVRPAASASFRVASQDEDEEDQPPEEEEEDEIRDQEEIVTEAISSFILRDMIPASIVEGAGFKALIETLESGYTLPSKEYFEDQLHTNYKRCREKLQMLLHKADSVALSCFTWTGGASQVFLSIAAHFVSAKLAVETFILSTYELPEEANERNSEDILQILLESTTEYGLGENKIIAIVHDNSEGLVEAVDMFKQSVNCESTVCMGVLLKDCIGVALGFPDISDTLNDARNLATFFRPGTEAATLLKKQSKKQYKDVLPDTTNHWMSTFNMCACLAEQQYSISAIAEMFKRREDTEDCCDLDADQWKVVHAIVQVLKPFAEAVEVLAEQNFISISSLRAILHSMEKRLVVTVFEDPSPVLKLKETIHTEIKQRFQLDSVQHSPLLSTIAAALDPRHKILKYHTALQKGQMNDSLIEVVEKQKQHLDSQQKEADDEIDSPPAAKKPKSGMSDLLGSDSEDEENEMQKSIESEIQTFAKDKMASKDSNPLEWWSLNKTRYPALSPVGASFMCIPCTASTPRDAFTKASLQFMPIAVSPSIEMVNIHMFLNCNSKLL